MAKIEDLIRKWEDSMSEAERAEREAMSDEERVAKAEEAQARIVGSLTSLADRATRIQVAHIKGELYG